jgi:hypothetical protein
MLAVQSVATSQAGSSGTIVTRNVLLTASPENAPSILVLPWLTAKRPSVIGTARPSTW